MNPRSLESWCVTETEESTPRVYSSLALTHNYPRDLGLICLVKKRKIRFRIFSDLRIQSSIFLKKRTLNQQHVCRCCNFSFVSNLIELFGAKSESENLLNTVGEVYVR